MLKNIEEKQKLELYYNNEINVLKKEIENKPSGSGITPKHAIQIINTLKGFHSDPMTGVINTSGDSVFTDLVGQFCYMFNQILDDFDEDKFKGEAYKEIV